MHLLSIVYSLHKTFTENLNPAMAKLSYTTKWSSLDKKITGDKIILW